MKRILSLAEAGFILLIALAPVFTSFPYRINIFLSWEGAYRISQGQIPFKDFGMPVGYMYWVIPAFFFKLFGMQLITLIKAQAFINIVAGFSFRSIFKSLNLAPPVLFLTVIVFCLSYSFFNYWPWYNHTVFVYELIALAFLFRYLAASSLTKWGYLYLVLAGMFVFFSFFTKQDGGGLAFLLCLALLIYHAWISNKWKSLLIFAGSIVVTGAAIILPLIPYGFGYWFNYGQPPHSSRISAVDIASEFLDASLWLKFYLLVTVLLLMSAIKKFKEFFHNKEQMLFTLLTLGILAQAAIFQVTSYVPIDNNIYFHSFAFAFILSWLATRLPIPLHTLKAILTATTFVFLWWSAVYWKYIERFIFKPGKENYPYSTYSGYKYADEVNKNTYLIELDTSAIPMNKWRTPNLRSFQKILLPGPTVDGMERLMEMPLVKNNKNLKVLNMTELTPLAAEMPFELERGSYYPLWFHKGVAMFDKETTLFTGRIQNNHYDLVLFEYIPYLNNFYPFKIRENLMACYRKVDSFPAPRNPSAQAWVEVYVKK